MTYAILPYRSISLGLTLIIGCILLGLLASLPAAAQDENLTRITIPMNDYAELSFGLPSEVVVEADVLEVLNYTGGREVQATLLLNGSKVMLHLLYPCLPPQTKLEPDALKSLLEDYNPAIKQVNYSDAMIGIGGLPAIFGQVGKQIFASYQPTNQTPAAIVMDVSTNEAIMVSFLENLQITVIEGNSPLVPGYCPDTTAASAEVKPADVEPAKVNAENNTAVSSYVAGQTGVAEAKKDIMSAKDKMAADRAAAIAMMQKAKERNR
jgi:hypothetical protein